MVEKTAMEVKEAMAVVVAELVCTWIALAGVHGRPTRH